MRARPAALKSVIESHRDSSRAKPQLLFAAALFAMLGGSACGHRASVKECEEIIDRIVRLEIKQHVGRLEPAEVQREVDTTKQKLRETTMKDCAGKRIYESTMRCVREAKTSKAIVEDCFD